MRGHGNNASATKSQWEGVAEKLKNQEEEGKERGGGRRTKWVWRHVCRKAGKSDSGGPQGVW